MNDKYIIDGLLDEINKLREKLDRLEKEFDATVDKALKNKYNNINEGTKSCEVDKINE